VLPGIALALEPPTTNLMAAGPRSADAPIMGPEQIRDVGTTGALLAGFALAAGLMGGNGNARQSQTIMFTSLVGAQLLHSLNCRSPAEGQADQTRVLEAVIGGSLALQAAAFMLAPIRRLLGLAPMRPSGIATMLGWVLASFLAVGATRR